MDRSEKVAKKIWKTGLPTLFQTQVFSLGTIFFGSDSSRIKREASNSPHLYASTLLGAITRSDLTLRYVLYKVESDPKKAGKFKQFAFRGGLSLSEPELGRSCNVRIVLYRYTLNVYVHFFPIRIYSSYATMYLFWLLLLRFFILYICLDNSILSQNDSNFGPPHPSKSLFFSEKVDGTQSCSYSR